MDEIKLREQHIDPMQEMYGEYPYYNTKKGFATTIINKFRKTIAPYNPLAYSQIPNQKRESLALRAGNRFYYSTPYPNTITFSKGLPVHYDPLASVDYKKPQWMYETRPPQLVPSISTEYAPRGCARTLKKFDICKEVNGQKYCMNELKDVYQICPNFVLEGMKNIERLFLKWKAMDGEEYRKNMEVSEYNKGRDVSSVSNKTWVHGTRKYLRPDTLYADERYSNITQPEIDAAKARIAEREKAKGITKDDHLIHAKHSPLDEQSLYHRPPLYP